MKKLCVFDLDGTLVDSIGDMTDALNGALNQMGRSGYTLEECRRMVGNGMVSLCRSALKEGTEEELAELIDLYREGYQARCCVKTCVYPGLSGVLGRLKEQGVSLAVLTNKPQKQTDAIVKGLFAPGFFTMVIGQSERFPRKPEPEALLWLMAQLGRTREETWYIGDSDVDMILGRRACVDTIGVTWGYRDIQVLRDAGVKYIARDSAALETYLCAEQEPGMKRIN